MTMKWFFQELIWMKSFVAKLKEAKKINIGMTETFDQN